jgi:glucans biosynthesis protein
LVGGDRDRRCCRLLAADRRTRKERSRGCGIRRDIGLIQRKRAFAAYDDLEAHYERRPSLWVEPIGDWGEGAVRLVEIPTGREIHDNIAAFWRPAQPLRAKGEYGFTYRLHWTAASPPGDGLAQIVDTRSGSSGQEKNRLFVLEAAGDKRSNSPGTRSRG